jgi:chemotaxis protein histidine kinase CheA
MIDNGKFWDLFFTSANEHLTVLETQFEQLSDIKNQQSLISELHRHVHSLKGEAFVMGYSKIGNLVTVLEKFFKKLKDENLVFPLDKTTEVKNAVSDLRAILYLVQQTKQEPPDLDQKIILLKNRLEVEPK